VPDDPEVPRSGAPGSPDPLPTLERDREVLAWLQCSTQLSGEVTGYLCDALLDWALSGGGYPQMALPEAGADCDHLLTLQQILERFPRWIAEAETVADKLELGHVGRLLARAYRASWDPQGVQDAFDRELLMAMPWLAAPPTPYLLADGSWV
jgi:hypothetical protein